MNKEELPEYFTIDELAERLKVHRGTLSNWRIAGRGPRYKKLGKLILYPVAEVAMWEENQIRQSTVEELK